MLVSWTRGCQGAEQWDAKMLVNATKGVDGSVQQVMEEITEAEKFIHRTSCRIALLSKPWTRQFHRFRRNLLR